LKSVNPHSLDILVGFDAVRFSTNVQVDKALQVVRNKLDNDNTLVEWSILKVKAITELLKFESHLERWYGYGKLSTPHHQQHIHGAF
jgi:hypothetical protein